MACRVAPVSGRSPSTVSSESTIDLSTGSQHNVTALRVFFARLLAPRGVHFSPEPPNQMSERDVIANQKRILQNQKSIVGNQVQIKANQETIKKNQATIIKNQKQILAAVNKK